MSRVHQMILELNEQLDELIGPEKLQGRGPQAALELMTWLNDFGAQLFAAAIADAEDQFFEDKAKRRELQWAAHDRGPKRERTVTVCLGPVRLRNDACRDSEGHQHSVLNEQLGFTTRQCVDEMMRNEIRESAAVHSYSETAKTAACGMVSRTSVFNYMYSLKVPEMAAPPEKRVCSTLLIHCDEDHIAEQTMHKGQPREHRSMNLSLAVVTEGRRLVRKGRYETIHPYRIVDLDTEALQEQIAAYLCQWYEIGSLERICVIGDGASWIQNTSLLEEWFPGKIVRIFDKFHVIRDLGRLNKQFKGRTVSKRLRVAMQERDRQKVNEILSSLGEAALTQTQTRRLEKSTSYYNNHFDAMAECLQPDAPASCTEPMVSHVLSKRLSTPGGAWSRHNAQVVGKLRAFQLNGGSLQRPESLNPPGHYKQVLADLEDVSTVRDFSMFEPTHYYACAPGGTGHLLDAVGHGGQLFGVRGPASMA